MEVKVFPNTHIEGSVIIPASKSYAQRAIALSLLVNGETTILGVGNSDDELAARSIIEKCGAKIEEIKNGLKVKSTGKLKDHISEVNVHESGLSTRMFTPILANSTNEIVVNGSGSILQRPMDFFITNLPKLNVSISTNNSFLPLKIKGSLIPKSITVDGSKSSQYITGLVYGYIASPKLKDEVITIKNLTSKPYLDLSLSVLKNFGVDLKLTDNKICFNGPYQLNPKTINVEGDWSSASFLLVAAAILGKVKIHNLNLQSAQSDIMILSAIKLFGADVKWDKNDLVVQKNNSNSFNFDATQCPDLFPPLAVLAVASKGKSRIKGIHRLTHKESNRALVIQREFRKVGVSVTLNESTDEMIIEGEAKIKGAVVDSNGDHRIAMAMAILGLISEEPITIKNAEAVTKSFPAFYEVLDSLIENKTIWI